MQHSQEAAGRFIVACGQPAKLLQATEKALDFVAVSIQISVNHALDEAVLLLGMTAWAPRAATLARTASVS